MNRDDLPAGPLFRADDVYGSEPLYAQVGEGRPTEKPNEAALGDPSGATPPARPLPQRGQLTPSRPAPQAGEFPWKPVLLVSAAIGVLWLLRKK